MVKNRHAAPREIAFTAPAGTPSGVEVLSLADLRSRVPPGSLAVPLRLTFHHLLTLTDGSLTHTVDFTDHVLEPGAWLWTRPGQVQQWSDPGRAEGTLVLFEQDFLDAATTTAARLDDPHAPVLHTPTGEDVTALRTAVDHLTGEFHAFGRLPLAVHTLALRHLLSALVLRLAHLGADAGRPSPHPGEAFLRFRDAVEEGFGRSRRVEDYALLLGYSPRTLSRAALAATGVGAKEFIDRRVVLEAKRLLAHGDESAARVASRLGFSSATNFSKFFLQRTGRSPLAFRSGTRGG
ncbi:AraC family transcriptional regulator [Umezawaea sp.]|uniref:helix-turn-helix domain-containing protein n=1 Tax=Umezawaea sp. TaxID=1955258 RepID=UPI002ED6A72A